MGRGKLDLVRNHTSARNSSPTNKRLRLLSSLPVAVSNKKQSLKPRSQSPSSQPAFNHTIKKALSFFIPLVAVLLFLIIPALAAAPTIINVSISPTPNASNHDNLTGYCNATDQEASTIIFYYKFYKNNVTYVNGVAFKNGSISAGVDHTCGIRSNDSRVLCWGYNWYGQLGNGTNSNEIDNPTLINDTNPYLTVSAGGYFTCGIRNDSRVLCWGDNTYGQLGDNDTVEMDNPTLINDTSPYLTVSAGGSHTCGIRSNDSRVLCWGYNGNGGLGDNTTTARNISTLTADTSPYLTVSAGGSHTCGIRANDSRVLCWGYNDVGKLGDNTTQSRKNPTLTNDTSPYLKISAGEVHTCGIRANDSRVLCWGDNSYGGLGDNTTEQKNVPTLINDTNQYLEVDAGSYYACGIRNNSIALCWGYNGNGQLGNGSGSGELHVPTQVKGTSTYLTVSVGTVHNCGIRANDSRVLCWGDNAYGQLGNGTNSNQANNATLTSSSSSYAGGFSNKTGATNVKNISEYSTYPVPIQNWTLGCQAYDRQNYSSWTNSTPTQVQGNAPPNMPSGRISPASPTILDNLSGYCNATDDNANNVTYYYEWYKNDVFNRSGSTLPTNYTQGTEISVSNISSINSSARDTWLFRCLASDGIENGSWSSAYVIITSIPPVMNTSRISPLPTVLYYENLSGFCNATDVDNDSLIYYYKYYKNNVTYMYGVAFKNGSISAGYWHTCGIRANDSRVLCWGDNTYGQLGNGSVGGQMNIPTLTTDNSSYLTVSAGYGHTCGIRANDSRILCWGDNSNGQLGSGTGGGNSSVPVLINGASQYLTVSVGYVHTCGIRLNDSRVLCWGNNNYGRLGDSTTTQRNVSTLTTDNSSYLTVNAGQQHTCGIRANDSRILCWGDNNYGQIGDNTTSDRYIPTPINDTSQYLTVGAGGAHTCGIRANDSRVLCWGYNSVGRLGDGTTEQKNVSTLTTDNSSYLTVSTGFGHTCGIRANDSRVLCWGYNDHGEIGKGEAGPGTDVYTPTLTNDASPYITVSSSKSNYHSCGIRANDSRVLCWGLGSMGELGDNTATQRDVPTLTYDNSSYAGKFNQSIEVNVMNISKSITSVGDNLTLSCQAFDGQSFSSWMNSTPVTILNAPVMITSRISPANPTNDNNLSGYCNATDPSGYNITYYYQWYKNGAFNRSGSTLPTNYTQGIEISVHNLTAANTTPGDNWTFSCLASDGTYNSSWMNSTPVAIPCAPLMITSRISPTPNAAVNDDLLGYCNSTDTNNHNLIYYYTYYKNNTPYIQGVAFNNGSISAGNSHTCGIRANDSRVLCWGDYYYGKLGNNYTTFMVYSPTLTTDTSAYITVSAGDSHTCGIRANDSRVLCWGWGNYGIIGDGDTSDKPIPTLTADTSPYITISAGDDFTCGIRANDSRTLCWGNGQGLQPGGNYQTPTLTTDTSPYITISSGYDHACGIRANDSRTLCWGSNAYGQLGLGINNTGVAIQPNLTYGNNSYLTVSAGLQHTCGIRANDSRTLCWGNNAYGQLGDNTTTQKNISTLINDTSPYITISAGGYYTCGIRANDSRVLCWGRNNYGQLGDNTTTQKNISTLIKDTSPYITISAGGEHTCGIRANDSRVLCWGNNGNGKLGDGTGTNQNISTLTTDNSSYAGRFNQSVEINVKNISKYYTSENQTWILSCQANDGSNPSLWMNSSTTTIVHAPVIITSRINPTNATNANNLSGYCNATDSDGHNVTYYYQWYKNGAFNRSGSTLPTNYTQGTEISVHNLTAANLSVGDNWTFSCLASDGTRNSSWMNSSTVTIADGYSPVMITSRINPTNATNANNLSGYCNATDPNSDNVTYYYQWYKNGAFNRSGSTLPTNYTQGTEISVHNLTAANLSVGDNWTFSCLASDGTRNSSWMNSSTVTIADGYSPVMQTSSILPASPQDADNLSGYCNATDPNNDNVTYYYQWYKNGAFNRSGSTLPTNYTQGTEISVHNLTAANTTIGDTWIFSCLASDGTRNSSWMNSSTVTIFANNFPPVINTSRISPASPTDDSNLSGYCNATDAGNESLFYYYTYYKNNTPYIQGVAFKNGSISAGSQHTCGIRANDSQVLCWGNNNYGQLGKGDYGIGTEAYVPTPTTDTSPYITISAGGAHTCGIRANDSKILCWGNNYAGQLGDDTGTDQYNPTLTNDTAPYLIISAGSDHTCGIRANDSQVLCWGYNYDGQIGKGDYGDGTEAYVPTPTTDTSPYITISAGMSHTCGIRANDSQVLCWGYNLYGQLGDNDAPNDKYIPTLTTDTSPYITISAGGSHTCGIRANDSKILCWGYNYAGQLGDDTGTDQYNPTLTNDTAPYLIISAGSDHTCGIRANDSKILCWGNNYDGQIGDNTMDNKYIPTLTTNTNPYITISAGGSHTCGIRANDSKILCWGYNYAGQLGKGDYGDGTQAYVPTSTSDNSSYAGRFNQSVEANVKNISKDYTIINQTWILSCRAFDGTYNSSWMNSTPVTIMSANSPVMQTSRILPASPVDADNLSGYCNATDPNGDNVTYYFQWYKNNALNTSGSTLPTNYTQGIERSVHNLTAANTTIGDNWTFSCLASDKTYNSSWLNSTPVTISAGTSSCTCPGAATGWNISMADYCNITTNCDITTGYLNFTGTGSVRFNATINCTSMQRPGANQIIYIDKNGTLTVH